MILPHLFIEVKSDEDKVKVEYSVERQRQLEENDKEKKMRNLNKRLKKIIYIIIITDYDQKYYKS